MVNPTDRTVPPTPYNTLTHQNPAIEQERKARLNHMMQEINRIIENYDSGNEHSEEERPRTPPTT